MMLTVLKYSMGVISSLISLWLLSNEYYFSIIPCILLWGLVDAIIDVKRKEYRK